MRSKIVAAETMEVGKKSGGKHWTAAQVAARKKAAEKVRRKKVQLIAPDWLSSGALFIWNRVVTDAAEINLLDNLDIDLLTTHCDAVDKYQTLSRQIGNPEILTADEDIKTLQAWARIISATSEKLGFTPSARARLIKKTADADLGDTFGDQFDQ
jgi:P27 family predicted phage terminase small subunit